MRKLLLSVPLLLVAVAAPLRAAEVQDERARITAERKAAEDRLEAEQKACWQKFAVNDCINDAKRRQRKTLAELKRQENKLNDQEREQRAAERSRAIEEKREKAATRADASAERHEQAVTQQQRREALAAEKAAKRATAAEPSPADGGKGENGTASTGVREQRAGSAQPNATSSDTEAHRKQFEERQRQAEERKARVLKREAERGKSAKPLPVPP